MRDTPGRRLLLGVDRLIGGLCRLGVWLAGGLLLVSLALVSYSVAMRYFANRPVPWVDELVGYLLVAGVMLSAGEVMRRGEHIAVDLITERLPAGGKRVAEVLALVAVTVAGLALLVQGIDTVAFSQLLGIRSTGYLAVPIAWPQSLIPVGGALLALAALGGLLRLALGLPASTGAPVEDQTGEGKH